MAKYSNGIMGAFSGAVGPVVGYEWKGRSCMRARGPVSNPRTERQQAGRKVFGAASSLSAKMKKAVSIGLRGAAAEGKTLEKNIFVRLNRHCFSIEGDTVAVDYTQLQVSQGSLAGVAFSEPQVSESMVVEVDFSTIEGEEGCGADYIYLYAYAPELDEGRLALPVERRDGHITASMPAHWLGCEVHLYGFAWDRDLASSNSAYLGSVTLTPHTATPEPPADTDVTTIDTAQCATASTSPASTDCEPSPQSPSCGDTRSRPISATGAWLDTGYPWPPTESLYSSS